MKNSINDNLRFISKQLYEDPSYTCFDAMRDSSEIADNQLIDCLGDVACGTILVGGSLGRAEMLPNSDIDAFVVDGEPSYRYIDFLKGAFNKVEIASLSTKDVCALSKETLVDGNRIMDSRILLGGQLGDDILKNSNTYDRQVANIISEWFYFRYFDYLAKRNTDFGPNIKYSAGSSRDIIFINWAYRLQSGLLPGDYSATGAQPEISRALSNLGVDNEVVQAMDLLLMSKNAAIDNYTFRDDWKLRYLNEESMHHIYQRCQPKAAELGCSVESDFVDMYNNSRVILESAIGKLVQGVVDSDPKIKALSSDMQENPDNLDLLLDVIKSGESHALISYACWLFTINNGTQSSQIIFNQLSKLDFTKMWGGVMALVCSPSIEDDTLRSIGEWLYRYEPGAYLCKLVARNNNASPATRQQMLQYYGIKETIQQ